MKYLFVFVILTYLVSALFPQFNAGFILSAFCLLIVLLTMFSVKQFVRVLGMFFLISGLIMLWVSHATWIEYIGAFGPMLDLITMITLIPILGIPIKIGRYSDDITTIIQRKVKTSGYLYSMTSGISYFFSIFMNLATLPMMYHSIKPALPGFFVKYEDQFMSKAITHGYVMPLMWAPVTPIVGIVISVTGVNWITILPYILPLSLFGLVLDWYLGLRSNNRRVNLSTKVSNNEMAAAVERGVHTTKRIFHIFWAILLFNVVISIGEFQLPYSFITLVSLLVIPFAFIWSIFLKKKEEFKANLLMHIDSFSIKMKDQFYIYLSAGFFISCLKISGTNDLLNSWIGQLRNIIGVDFFLIVLPLIPLVFAFLGFHPAVTVTIMAESLNPEMLGISSLILTVAMLAGAVSAFLVGPFNATVALMSSIVKESSFKVAQWNMSFTSLYIGSVMVYLFLLQRFQT